MTAQFKKPKIELKNVKHMASLSQETNAYTASVYVDGVKYAEASNHGHGAGDDFYLAEGAEPLAELNKRILATYPRDEKYNLDMNLELVVGDILEDFLLAKSFKSLISRKVVLLNDKKQIVSLSGKKTPEGMKFASTKWPTYICLNTLPEAEAFALYRKHG